MLLKAYDMVLVLGHKPSKLVLGSWASPSNASHIHLQYVELFGELVVKLRITMTTNMCDYKLDCSAATIVLTIR